MTLRLLCIVLVAGCLPSNTSGDYECTSNDQCKDGRACDRGYCVLVPIDATPACPDGCDTCNLATRQCTILCINGNDCNRATCPDDYDCVIQCGANNSCDIVDCSEADSCQITCSGTNSCDTIECGTGACDITCLGSSSCAQVDCTNSCECDVSCAPSASCQTSCPDAPVAPNKCTEDGTATTPCDSSFDPACDSC
jgi:hypothetical protein